GRVAERIAPHGQSGLEPELRQVLGVRVELAADAFLLAELVDGAVGGGIALAEVVEHHDAAERRRQRGDEQPMIAPRGDAGDRARGVPPEAVGHQPLARQSLLALRARGGGPLDAPHQVVEAHVAIGSGRKTSEACPGSVHTPIDGGATVPPPPYRGCSLDHSSVQRVSAGGASSGSGRMSRTRSTPRLTSIRRSSSPSPKNRTTKASSPSTAPSTPWAPCAAKTASSRRNRNRSQCSA